jgi:WD40 repeat protein
LLERLARSLALAFALCGAPREWTSVMGSLDQQGARALTQFARDLCDEFAMHDSLVGRPGSVLLVLDQAEELVTRTGQVERDAFLGLLRAAVRADGPMWVIATVRSEFLSAAAEHAGLIDLIDDTMLLGALVPERLTEVIARPAQRAGLTISPALVAQMAADTVGGDALPLLAYALRMLADWAGPGGEITARDYERLGGVVGALRTQADAVRDELDRQGLSALVLPTLTKLASVDTEGPPTRRRVQRYALTSAENDVVQAFVDARLLTSDGAGEFATLEVAHEALLRQWAPLRQAIEASRGELRIRSELERLASDWQRAGRRESYLLRGDRLADAQRWAAIHAGQRDELPLVWAFIEHAAVQEQAAAERAADALADRVLNNLPDRELELNVALAVAAIDEYAVTPRAIAALTKALASPHPLLEFRSDQGVVRGVAFSPDGAFIITTADHQTVRVWDAASGDEVLTLRGHEGDVYAVAVSADGTRIATAASDQTARVWDAARGDELLILRGHTGMVTGVAFSPDGTRVATAGDQTTRVWDAATGAELLLLDHRIFEPQRVVAHVAFSTDGTRIATAGNEFVQVWDAASGAELLTLRGHKGAVNDVAFSADGTRIASAGQDWTVRVWDAASGAELLVLRGHKGAVNDVAFSADGTRILTAGDDQSVRVWHTIVGDELLVLGGHKGAVTGVAFSPDGTKLATAGHHTARLWTVDVAVELLVMRGHEGRDSIERQIWDVAFSPEGNRIATAGGDSTVRVWDAATGEELLVLYGHEDAVNSVAFSPDGTRIATAGGKYDNSTRVWDAAGGAELLVLRGPQRAVNSVAFSPDGTRIATADNDNSARVWDAANGAELLVLRGHEWVGDNRVSRVVFSPDGRRIATAAGDNTVRVWDAGSGAELLVLRGHERVFGRDLQRGVGSVAFAPDGTRIATAGDDETARVWDAVSGAELLVLRGHADAVTSVAFSPDGTRIATAGEDWTVRVWDAASGAELLVLRGHKGAVNSLAFSPDGTRILTGASDNTARVWINPTLDHLLQRGRDQIFRPLTDEERRRFGLSKQSSL